MNTCGLISHSNFAFSLSFRNTGTKKFNKSINQSAQRSTKNQSIVKIIHQSNYQLINQKINQSIKQFISLLIKQIIRGFYKKNFRGLSKFYKSRILFKFFIIHNPSLGWGHVRSHTKFGPVRFSSFDVY